MVFSQIALYESLLASEHRTTNGDEADFFYVPFLQACIVEQGDAAPHLTFQVLSGVNSFVVVEGCLLYVLRLYPFNICPACLNEVLVVRSSVCGFGLPSFK